MSLVLKGLKSSMMSVFRILMQLSTQILMARILGPKVYGVFLFASTVVGFATFLADYGISYLIIQYKEIDDKLISFIFTQQLLISSIVCVIINIVAAPISSYFHFNQSLPILRLLSLVLIINAISSVSINLMRRAYLQVQIERAQIISYLIGYVLIGIPLGLMKFGPWTLTVAWLMQSLLLWLLCYRKVKHTLKLNLHYINGRSTVKYGIKVLATNIGNWTIVNADRIMISKNYTSQILGLYSTPFNMMYNSVSALFGPIQQMLLRLFSQNINVDTNNLPNKDIYLSLMNFIVVVFGLIFSIVSLHSWLFVHIIYGAKWMGSVEIFRVISMCMPFFFLWAISTPMLWAAGKGHVEAIINLPMLFIWIIVTIQASKFSITLFSMAVLSMYMFRCIVIVYAVIKIYKIQFHDLMAALLPGICLVGLFYISIKKIQYIFIGMFDNLFFVYSASIFISIIIIIGFLYVYMRSAPRKYLLLYYRFIALFPLRFQQVLVNRL